MTNTGSEKTGYVSWKGMLAILSVAVMVAMSAAPMVSAAPAEQVPMFVETTETENGLPASEPNSEAQEPPRNIDEDAAAPQEPEEPPKNLDRIINSQDSERADNENLNSASSLSKLDIRPYEAVPNSEPSLAPTASIMASNPFTPLPVPFSESFETGWGYWTPEILNPYNYELTQWEIGDPIGTGPGTAYSGTNCAGTNINDRYYAYNLDIALNSPYIELGPWPQKLSFRTWYNLWEGCYNAEGGFVEINNGWGWNQIYPESGYPDYGGIGGYWTDGFVGTSDGWEYYEFDLSGYSGEVIQLRFHFAGWSCRNYWGWYVDDVFVGSPPAYDCSLTPEYQVNTANPGDNADYILTATNAGINEDTYDLASTGVWPVTFFDLGMNPITEIGPLYYGESYDFIARVAVDIGAAPGTSEITDVTLESQKKSSVSDTAQVRTNVPLENMFEDFESGWNAWTTEIINPSSYKPTEWEIGDPDGTGPGTAYSGTNCAGTNIDDVYYQYYADITLVSPYVHLGAGSQTLNFQTWYNIRGGCSGARDGGFVEIDNGGGWTQIYPIGGYPESGDVGGYYTDAFAGSSSGWEFYEFDLSGYSGDMVQVRFHFASWYCWHDYWGWYVDDVYLGSTPEVYLDPVHQVQSALPGFSADYLLTVTNDGNMNNVMYDLSSSSIWPVTFFDLGMNPITEVGPVTHFGGTEDFIARVTVDGAAQPGDMDLADITVTSQLDSAVTDTAQVVTQVPYLTLSEDFESGWGAWSTEIINPSSESPTEWEIGDPMGTGPGDAYSGSQCAGTNIDDVYYEYGADITLVSPYVYIGGGIEILSFYTWYDIRYGCWATDGGFVEINNGGGWNQIYPFGGYPENGYVAGYWTDCFSGSSGGWDYYVFDLSGYSGDTVQVRFHFASDYCWHDYWGWYVDEILLGAPPLYDFELAPVHQSGVAHPGNTADYTLTVTNMGLNDDTYDLSYSGIWPVTFFDTGMNPITEIGPIGWGGGTADFIARVTVDGTALPGEIDIADITVTSQGDSSVSESAQVQTYVPLLELSEDFESGWNGWSTEIINPSSYKPTEWEIGDPNGAGPGMAFEGLNCAGTNIDDIYYEQDADITLMTPFVQLGSGSPILNFQTWYDIRYGCIAMDGGFVEIDNGGGWTQIYPDGGYPASGNMGGYWTDGYSDSSSGWEYYEFDLSAYAGDLVQVRFHFASDYCWHDYWGWYVDEVFIGHVAQCELTPESQSGYEYAGNTVDYYLTVTNTGTSDATYDLSYSSAWPVTFYDLGMNPITEIAAVSWGGGTADFIMSVDIDNNAEPGDFEISKISVTSQSEPMDTASARVITQVPFETFFEDFESGWGAWTAEIINPSSDKPTIWEMGNPMGTGPGDAYSGSQCAGTNIDDYYYPDNGDITLVSPYVEVGEGSQILSFFTWYKIWYGCGARDGGFVEINDGGGWTQIYPESGYPDSGAMGGYYTDGYSGGSVGWEYYQFDLSGYSGELVQMRFHFAAQSCREMWGWYLDDIYIGAPMYDMVMMPDFSYISENPGTWVTYYFTVYNTGIMPDTYTLHLEDANWPTIILDADGLSPIGEIGPVPPGGSMQFTVMVYIPTGLPIGSQDYVWVVAESQTTPGLMDVSLIITESDPWYWFDVGPADQIGIGWVGDYVDHPVTIWNTGALPDTYRLFCERGMFTWPTEIWDKTNDHEISHSEPVPPGGSFTFNVRVRIPRVDWGDSDWAEIGIESVGDPNWQQFVWVNTRTSLEAPFYDDFESEEFGEGPYTSEDWATDNPDLSGVNDWTSNSPDYSMYTNGGAVTVTSAPIYLAGLNQAVVSFWLQRGSWSFSEYPDSGEDLVVEYFNSHNRWVELDTFYGGGPEGEEFFPLYILGEDACHEAFRLRFRQLAGSGEPYDYWHIDDVYIGQGNPIFELTPDHQESLGTPGGIVTYTLQIENMGVHGDMYTISLAGNSWLTVIPQTVGPVGPGQTATFTVDVHVPDEVPLGYVETAEIIATSQVNPWVSDNAYIHTSLGTVHNLDLDLWYGKIQEAVYGADPGNTIWAYPKTYQETVVVDKPLTIHGVDRETTVVNGVAGGSSGSTSDWFGYSDGYTENSLGLTAGGDITMAIELSDAELAAFRNHYINELSISIGADGWAFMTVNYEIWVQNTLPAYGDVYTGGVNVVASGVSSGGPGWDLINIPDYAIPDTGSVFIGINFLGTVAGQYPCGFDQSTGSPTPRANYITYNGFGSWSNLPAIWGSGVWGIDVGLAPAGGGPTFTVRSDSVTVDGFTIEGDSLGVLLESVQGCTVTQNTITAPNGIRSLDSGLNTISDCEIVGESPILGVVINEFNTAGPDWVELYNYGPDQDMTGWIWFWNDDRGYSDQYTFPAGFILPNHGFVQLIEDGGSNDATHLYIGHNMMWDASATGVAGEIRNNLGQGVDFFKTGIDPTVPTAPTVWNAPNIPHPVAGDMAWRNSDADTDSGTDWSTGVANTPVALNPGQAGTASGGGMGYTGIEIEGSGYSDHVHDDFSTDTGLWTYYSNALLTGGYGRLTQNIGGQVGQILFNQQVNTEFIAEFRYLAGGGSGADGLAMNFFKEPYVPATGGALGMVDGDFTSLGYSVEFDNYENGGDPSANHIAIVQNHYLNHLASVNDARTEDNVWHSVKVVVTATGITVYVDDMVTPLLSYVGVIDMTFGGLSFSAGTGGLTNNHFVDDISITWNYDSGTTVFGNTIRNFETGMKLVSAEGNLIYHNDFIDNTVHAVDDMSFLENAWDSGYPGGGNYWGGFTGPDTMNGPLQNLPGADGIIDFAYMIDGDSFDQYPFAEPFSEPLGTTEPGEALDEPVTDPEATGGSGKIPESTEETPEPLSQDTPAEETAGVIADTDEIPADEPSVTDVPDETITESPADDAEAQPVPDATDAEITPAASVGYLSSLMALSVILMVAVAALYIRERR